MVATAVVAGRPRLTLPMGLDPVGARLSPGLWRPTLNGQHLAKALPAGYAAYASRGRWVSAPHLTYLSLKLADAHARRVQRLLIMMPPRHGKSQLISEYLPAWWLGKSPDDRVALGSYHERFAASWGRKSRDNFVETAARLWKRQLRRDLKASNDWGIAHHVGGMRTAGAGGAMTGYGAHLLIFDDPVKDAKDANSATVRENIWDWWQSTAYTRLEPGGVAIGVMTRWHEDDLMGRLLAQMKEGGEAWEVIRMPAIAEEDELWQYGSWSWQRKKGEALWSARYPLERLLQIQKSIGSYWWGALFQQNPTPLGGGIFKREWFRYAVRERSAIVLKKASGDTRVPIDLLTRFMTVDLAISQKDNADYLVISHWGLTRANELILLDVFRDRVPGPEQLGLLHSQYERFRPGFIGVEATAYQALLVQQAASAGLPVVELTPDADKVTRALTGAARMQSEHVYFCKDVEQLDECEKELLDFGPAAARDDFVDTLSYAAAWVVENCLAGGTIREL